MDNKKRVPPLGQFLAQLRKKKNVSLKEVEKATGISNAYISQLENGARTRLPTPDRLRKIAAYYNVSINELMQKAGYFDKDEIGQTMEQKIEQAFLHAMNDPQFTSGSRLNPKELCLDIKRFIAEMYQRHFKTAPNQFHLIKKEANTNGHHTNTKSIRRRHLGRLERRRIR